MDDGVATGVMLKVAMKQFLSTGIAESEAAGEKEYNRLRNSTDSCQVDDSLSQSSVRVNCHSQTCRNMTALEDRLNHMQVSKRAPDRYYALPVLYEGKARSLP